MSEVVFRNAAFASNPTKSSTGSYSTAAALASVLDGDHLVVEDLDETLTDCITIDGIDNLTIEFKNVTLSVRDDGATGTITNGSSGPIGLLFKNCANLTLLGSLRMIGLGTEGTTKLAGMVIDTCDDAVAPLSLYCENMAAGQMVAWSDHGIFGDVTSYKMKGTQTFGSGTAGSARVVWGCDSSAFGKTKGKMCYKPVLYCSLAADASAAKIDNTNCTFGIAAGSVYTGSIEASVLSIRSAKDCIFDGATGNGQSVGLWMGRYNTDTGWSVHGNTIGRVSGTYPATGASVDAAVQIDCDVGYDVGTNQITSVIASVAGEWGIYAGTGKTQIGQITLRGSPTRGAMIHSCSMQINQMSCTGQAYEALLFGQGANIDIGLLDVQSGTTAAASAAVLYNSAYGSGGQLAPNIPLVRYRQNSIGSNYNYVVALLTGGAQMLNISHIDGNGASNQAYFHGDEFKILKGEFYSTQAPTAATAYTKPCVVKNSNPSAGGVPGWALTTAGSPGTWKAEAALAA